MTQPNKLTVEELEKAIEHTTGIVNLPMASKVYKQLLDTMRENERLREFLSRLVHHDRAASIRDGLEGCIELQRAEDYLQSCNRTVNNSVADVEYEIKDGVLASVILKSSKT